MPACDIIEEIPVSGDTDEVGGGASSHGRENTEVNTAARGIVNAYRSSKDCGEGGEGGDERDERDEGDEGDEGDERDERDEQEGEEGEQIDVAVQRRDDRATVASPSSSFGGAEKLRASREEILERIAKAEKEKTEGNAWFGKAAYGQASEQYTMALELLPLPDEVELGEQSEADGSSLSSLLPPDVDNAKLKSQRCVLFANRAACRLQEGDYEGTAEDCSNALELDGGYVKAYVRRAKAYEALEEYDQGLADVRKAMELGGGTGNTGWAEAYVRRVGPLAERRQEEMKEEMIGKLKELGNSFLGNFGLSLDNFKAEQGPDGGYSIKFG